MIQQYCKKNEVEEEFAKFSYRSMVPISTLFNSFVANDAVSDEKLQYEDTQSYPTGSLYIRLGCIGENMTNLKKQLQFQ